MQGDLRVAGWVVQPRLGRIEKAGQSVRVRAKVLDLLVYFARHPGEVVSKDDLLRDVWGTEAISESALTRTLAELRQVLGDDVEHPSIVETIPKRGYRLIAPVISATDDTTHGGTAADGPHADRGGNGRRTWAWVLASVATLLVAGVTWITLQGPSHPGLREAIPEPDSPMPSRKVTSLDGVEWYPSLSPDGSQLAFVWHDDLYVKAVDSGEPHQIARNVFATAWSPDGQWIATYRNTDEPGHHTLLLVSPTGGERKIGSFHVPRFSSLDWSPDGHWIALTLSESGAGAARVFVVSTTDERRPLSRPPPEANFDADPHFSNDGRRLAFFRNFSVGGMGVFEIRTVGLDGTDETLVARLEGAPMGIGWAPSDRSLVLSMRTPDNLAGLWRIPLDGSPRTAYEVGEACCRFSISGHKLAYMQLTSDARLWLSSGPSASQKQPRRQFIPDIRDVSEPRFSPDGRRVAVVRSSQILVCPSDGGASCSPLTHQGIWRAPTWSPDSESLVFAGNNDLYIVEAHGGVPRPLMKDLAADNAPGFSLDGKWVYFNTKRSPAWQIWRVPTAGGALEHVSSVGGGFVRAAKDGWLYLAGGIGTLERMRADGSDRQILKEGLQAPVAWTLWQGIPLFRQGDVIYKIDPRTRETGVFWRLDASPPGHTDSDTSGTCRGFDVSPDGRWVISCEARPQGDLVLIENFR